MATIKKPFLRYYTREIPAGRKLPLDLGGRWFVCKESTGRFDIAFDDGQECPCEVGIGFVLEDDDGNPAKFKKITLVNTSATAITVGFYVGTTRVIDSRLNTLVDRTINVVVSSTVETYTKGTTGTLNPGITAFFFGNDGAKKRISFSVFNRNTLASGDAIVVLGANGQGGHEVDGRGSYGVVGGGTIGIWNNSANPIDYRVMETFPV